MDARAHSAVGARDHVLPPDPLGEADDPLGDELGVFDQVRRVGDDARRELLPFRQLYVLPEVVLVLVAHIRGLDRVDARVHLEHQVDDLRERDVRRVRPVPAAPAEVVAHALLGDPVERVVQRFDT